MTISVSDSAFQEWASNFEKRHALANIRGEFVRQQVCRTIDEIHNVSPNEETISVLRDSLMLACYQAVHWDEERDRIHIARESWKTGFGTLPEQAMRADGLIRFIDTQENLSISAMQASDKTLHAGSASEAVEELRGLLNRFLKGISDVTDINHRLHHDIDRDWQYGPFLLVHQSLTEKSVSIRDIKILGLLFSLSYIFRYFTCEPFQRPTSSKVVNGRLLIAGKMINNGQPRFDLVANLTNAALGVKLSQVTAKEKLRDFIKSDPSSTIKKDILWSGW